jgi:hypothetical protein
MIDIGFENRVMGALLIDNDLANRQAGAQV